MAKVAREMVELAGVNVDELLPILPLKAGCMTSQ
jgi:hypothetical protein